MKTRRQFLVNTSMALLGVGAASLSHADDSWAQTLGLAPSAQPPRAPKRMPDGFPTLNFITADPDYSDYRPAIDCTGMRVVFERTPKGGKLTSMYITTFAEAAAQPFVKNSQGFFTGPSQTRPDWSWKSDQVVMNVAESDEKPVRVLVTDADGNPLNNVFNSDDYVYPTWTPDGKQLIVFNSSLGAWPRPCTSLIDLGGNVLQGNLDGKDANDVPMYGGFATPRPSNATLIAYAGQPEQAWGAAISGYSQDYNYVFVNAENNGGYTSAPLETDASIDRFDPTHQGRAPVWSPDGRYVAFESDRAGGYAIFLFDTLQGGAPVQLTDSHYGAQHAKFFPDGTKIVLTCLQKPGKAGPRGIAWIDISSYL